MPLDDPISRRDFLRHGALLSGAALAAGASGLSWLGPTEAEAAIMGIGKELRDVLNLETVNQILIEALRRGGDFADLFAEQRFKTAIVLDDQKIDSVSYGYPRGAGGGVSEGRRDRGPNRSVEDMMTRPPITATDGPGISIRAAMPAGGRGE